MLDLMPERLFQGIDALIDLGNAEAGIEAQRELDENHPTRAARPDPGELAIIVGVAEERAVDRLVHFATCGTVKQIGEAGTQEGKRIALIGGNKRTI